MAKLNYKNGVISVVLRVKIMDSTSTSGAAKTGLTSASSGLIVSTIADNEATATAYTGSNLETITTLGTFAAPTSGKARFKEVDATNHPGLYEIQIADARWAVSNARSVIVSVLGVTGAAQVDAELQLEPVPANLQQIDSQRTDGNNATLRLKQLEVINISGSAIVASGSGSNGHGLVLSANGTGSGLQSTGGATGSGIKLVGGATSGDGLLITTTSGHGMSITATGASKHGVIITGGDSGTSDGLKLVAGTGGVGFRLDTLTASGAVTLASTLTISGTTSLAALSTSGTVTFNALTITNALTVSGATTLTGAVTASNASNNIVGVTVAALAANTVTASALATDAVNEIVDQVWREAIADHSGTAGSTAEKLNAAGSAGDPWTTALPGAYSAGQAGKIVGDNLNATISSRASQTSVDTVDDFLDTEVAAIKAKTDNLPTDPADQSAVEAAITAATSGLATQTSVNTIDDFLDTEIAAIKAKTDNLPSDPADASDVAASFSTVNGTLTTIAGYLDTEIAAIKAKTDNLPAAPAAVGDIPTVSQIWTTALTEAYRATGATGTAAQLLYELLANLTNFSNSGVTRTATKLDKTTTAKTYTYDDSNAPTSIEEAT